MKSLLAALVAIAALALPSLALAGGQTGIVVKVDGHSGLVAVVQGKGAVSLVHASAPALRGLQTGSRVVFDARRLRNGTYAADKFTVRGAVRSVHVRGTIFAVEERHAAFALSAHGAVLALKLARHARVLASCGCPHVGGADVVTLEFGAGGSVEATTVTQVDPTADAGAIDGTVSADAGGRVTVADGAYAITVLVPAWFDPSKLALGEHVIAYFVRRPDGSYAIEAVANDGSVAQADDAADEQGDVQKIENQVGLDEQLGEQAGSDQTDLQLAEAELADDQAAISNDLQEGTQECMAHLDELKASGAAAADLAAARVECQQQLAQGEQQAGQDLQDCNKQLGEQVAGDPEAGQQLAADAQQAEGELQQSERQDEQEVENDSSDSGSSGPDSGSSGPHSGSSGSDSELSIAHR